MNRKDFRTAALEKIKESGEQAIKNSIAQDKPYLADTIEYTKEDISDASSIVKLVKAGKTENIGIQSFNDNMLDDGEHMVIDSIKLEYAKEDATAPLNPTIVTADYNDTAPAALMNAQLRIIQKGKELVNVPVSSIHNPNATEKNEDRWTVVGHMPILLAKQQFDIEIHFPDGTSMTTANEKHFVQVDLRGYKLKKN